MGMVLAVCECVEPTNGRMGMVLARMGMVLAVCECIDLDVVCCRFISRRRKILGSRVILLVMGTNRTRSLIVFAKLQVPSYYITWYYSYNVCISYLHNFWFYYQFVRLLDVLELFVLECRKLNLIIQFPVMQILCTEHIHAKK